MGKREIWGIVGFLAAACAAWALSGLGMAVRPWQAWYAELAKPSWNPPPWLFAPVWALLYLAIGVAGWLLWRQHAHPWRRAGLALWIVQLVLNAAWTYVFFAGRQIGAAAVELGVMWVAIAATAVVAWRIQTAAGLLLVPYLGWVTYALAINVAVWQLNR